MADDTDVLKPDAKTSFKEFSVIDPYNENQVDGRLHQEPTQMYGALEIERVNGKDAKQTIWCTPKMRYPFSKDGQEISALPKNEEVQVYEKLDGTNIFGFVYCDAEGKEYVSYKTRLMPFLKADKHKFGDFRSMWNEILARYPEIPDLVKRYRGVSFEMYGKKNQILIQYDVPLEVALLFAVPGPASIISPAGLEAKSVPKARMIKRSHIGSVEDFKGMYWEVRDWLNQNLKVEETLAKSSEGEEIVRKLYFGLEGTVWYAVDKDDRIMDGVPFKCKPDAVFDICASGTIPLHSIQITIRNALEQDEPLTFELVRRMLLEEFPEDKIYAKQITIQKEVDRVIEEQRLIEEIAPLYMENGFDIDRDKGTCMRFFGQRYPKNLAAKIFSLLSRQFGKS